MARFNFNGVDGLMADFDKLATVDADTEWSILDAGAQVLKRFHQEGIINTFVRRSGALANSIEILRKDDGGKQIARVTPKASIPAQRWESD